MSAEWGPQRGCRARGPECRRNFYYGLLPYVVVAADYIRVAHPDPHASRGRELLAAHPDLRRIVR